MPDSTDDSVLQHVGMDVERKQILKNLRSLAALLDAPETLVQLLMVSRNFGEILAVAAEVADQATRSQIGELENCIDFVQENIDEIEQFFPEANNQRKSVHGKIGSNPHYCLYAYKPKVQLIGPYWRGLVATVLPLSLKLTLLRKSKPKEFASAAGAFFLSLRKLVKPSETELMVLTELPCKATDVNDYCSQFEEVVERLEVDFSNNQNPSLYWIHRVLQWEKDGAGEWRQGRAGSGMRIGGKRSPRRKISDAETARSFERSVAVHISPDGDVHHIPRYFSRRSEREVKVEAFDKAQAYDQTPVECNLKLRPSKVMDYFLQNRATQNRQNAKFAAQAIEMDNQHLPVSNATLSGLELFLFLDALDKLKSDVWSGIPESDRPGVAAWAACRFFLSRDPVQLMKFKVCEHGSTSEAPALALREKAVWLLAVPPRHKAPEESKRTLPVKRAFELRLPQWLFNRLAIGAKAGRPLFKSDYEKMFHGLLGNLNSFIPVELTPHRIERTVAEQMSQLAPADWAITTYFVGGEPNNVCVR